MLQVTEDEISTIYSKLHQIGCLGESPDAGFLRAGWSTEEGEAISLISKLAEAEGLVSRFDSLGNLALETPEPTAKYIETGSHLDTVVLGGNYDGAAGVVAGLCAIRAILRHGGKRRHGLRLRVWRGEEGGTFTIACKGSQAAFGLLPAKVLDQQFRGKSLRQAIVDSGFNPASIERGTKTISQEEVDSVAAHIELHIEQANFLEQEGIDVGVVTSIRGPLRYRVLLEGSFDHSGGTPMGAKFRKDANLALGYVMVALDELAKEVLERGADLVQTVGVINSDPAFNEQDGRVYQNAIAKVSGFSYFVLDIRSSQTKFRHAYGERAVQTIIDTAARFGVRASCKIISNTEPLETLDANVRNASISAARSLGVSACEMPSGALHDCLYLGQQKQSSGENVPIGMLFIPCLAGRSHCPEEFTTYEAIAKGASVLAVSMAKLAE